MPIEEIYVSFAEGSGFIECDGCNAAEMADALIAIAENLRTMDETPGFISYEGGKISHSFSKGADYVD
jgi:hypothetical protein